MKHSASGWSSSCAKRAGTCRRPRESWARREVRSAGGARGAGSRSTISDHRTSPPSSWRGRRHRRCFPRPRGNHQVSGGPDQPSHPRSRRQVRLGNKRSAQTRRAAPSTSDPRRGEQPDWLADPPSRGCRSRGRPPQWHRYQRTQELRSARKEAMRSYTADHLSSSSYAQLPASSQSLFEVDQVDPRWTGVDHCDASKSS